MPNTTNKANIRRTITDLGYAPITAIDSDGVPTYGSVVWFVHHEAGGREYNAEPAGSSGSVWADGREVYAWEDSQGYNVTLTTVGVTDDIDEAWYGRTVLESGAVEEYADGAEYPHFALVIVEDTTDGTGETTIFYDCHIQQRSGKQGATSEGNGLNPQFPQHNIAARPRLDCFAVNMTLPSKTKITTIPEPTRATPHVSIAEATASVAVGSTVALTVDSVYPAGATITWTSGATAKAMVSADGVVTGVAAGTSVITATITVGGTTYTDTCNVTVTSS
jgi:uncharacterized protein YjdB